MYDIGFHSESCTLEFNKLLQGTINKQFMQTRPKLLTEVILSKAIRSYNIYAYTH